jgi:hypothetical protein
MTSFTSSSQFQILHAVIAFFKKVIEFLNHLVIFHISIASVHFELVNYHLPHFLSQMSSGFVFPANFEVNFDHFECREVMLNLMEKVVGGVKRLVE